MKDNLGIHRVAVHLRDGHPSEYLYQVDADLLFEQYSGEDGFDAAALAQDIRSLATEYEKKEADTGAINVLQTLADSVEEYNDIPVFISVQV